MKARELLIPLAIALWTLDRLRFVVAEIAVNDWRGALHYGSDAAMGMFTCWVLWLAWQGHYGGDR